MYTAEAYLNQWKSMGFYKLILDFYKSCNVIGQKNLGLYHKNKVFL